MNRALAFAVLVAVGISGTQGAWNLAWEDNFDGGNLRDRWNFEVNCDGGGNNELQCYTDNLAKNCRQENGVLIITALLDGSGGRPFSSTRMTTKASWLHGKFDIRARLPKGKHLWPAIWMMPQASAYGGWPRSGEIDIMEYRGQQPSVIIGTLHYGPAWDNKGQVGYDRNFNGMDYSADFHTFTLDWSPMEMQWIIDDQVIHRESLARNFWQGLYTGNGQPFDRDFFLILNLAVGGNFFGGEPFNPDESNGWAKRTLEVDYVRKWVWS